MFHLLHLRFKDKDMDIFNLFDTGKFLSILIASTWWVTYWWATGKYVQPKVSWSSRQYDIVYYPVTTFNVSW